MVARWFGDLKMDKLVRKISLAPIFPIFIYFHEIVGNSFQNHRKHVNDSLLVNVQGGNIYFLMHSFPIQGKGVNDSCPTSV